MLVVSMPKFASSWPLIWMELNLQEFKEVYSLAEKFEETKVKFYKWPAIYPSFNEK